MCVHVPTTGTVLQDEERRQREARQEEAQQKEQEAFAKQESAKIKMREEEDRRKAEVTIACLLAVRVGAIEHNATLSRAFLCVLA